MESGAKKYKNCNISETVQDRTKVTNGLWVDIVGIVDNIDHHGFYRSFVVIFGYRRDFYHGRENQRTLCNFSIWTVADVGLYKKAVLWQRNHTMPL